MIRWPGQIQPRSSYAMFSIIDFFPTFARIAGGAAQRPSAANEQ
jgi:arylsulfatase